MDYKDILVSRELRSQLIANPRKYLKEVSNASLEDVEIKVVENKKDVLYFVVPNSVDFSDANLSAISAAGGSSTAGTAGTIGTIGSWTSTVSTAASAATIGCAGSLETT